MVVQADVARVKLISDGVNWKAFCRLEICNNRLCVQQNNGDTIFSIVLVLWNIEDSISTECSSVSV